MDDHKFSEREHERADRLFEFIKGEVLNMQINARLHLVNNLFNYLTPEIKVLLQEGKIESPDTRW